MRQRTQVRTRPRTWPRPFTRRPAARASAGTLNDPAHRQRSNGSGSPASRSARPAAEPHHLGALVQLDAQPREDAAQVGSPLLREPLPSLRASSTRPSHPAMPRRPPWPPRCRSARRRRPAGVRRVRPAPAARPPAGRPARGCPVPARARARPARSARRSCCRARTAACHSQGACGAIRPRTVSHCLSGCRAVTRPCTNSTPVPRSIAVMPRALHRLAAAGLVQADALDELFSAVHQRNRGAELPRPLAQPQRGRHAGVARADDHHSMLAHLCNHVVHLDFPPPVRRRSQR